MHDATGNAQQEVTEYDEQCDSTYCIDHQLSTIIHPFVPDESTQSA